MNFEVWHTNNLSECFSFYRLVVGIYPEGMPNCGCFEVGIGELLKVLNRNYDREIRIHNTGDRSCC